MPGDLTGTRSCRSLVNDPELSVEFNDRGFGAGAQVLQEPKPEEIARSLGGSGWSLNLSGKATGKASSKIRFQGRGPPLKSEPNSIDLT